MTLKLSKVYLLVEIRWWIRMDGTSQIMGYTVKSGYQLEMVYPDKENPKKILAPQWIS